MNRRLREVFRAITRQPVDQSAESLLATVERLTAERDRARGVAADLEEEIREGLRLADDLVMVLRRAGSQPDHEDAVRALSNWCLRADDPWAFTEPRGVWR